MEDTDRMPRSPYRKEIVAPNLQVTAAKCDHDRSFSLPLPSQGTITIL